MSLVVGQGVVEWVAKRTNEHGNFGAAQGIGWEKNGVPVVGVVYNDFNGVNCCTHIASEGSHWLTREYLWTIFHYPFRQLKVKRITAPVGEGNAASRRFVEHLGFEREATLSQAHPTGDLLVYRMFREDCAWISPAFEKRYAKAA